MVYLESSTQMFLAVVMLKTQKYLKASAYCVFSKNSCSTLPKNLLFVVRQRMRETLQIINLKDAICMMAEA